MHAGKVLSRSAVLAERLPELPAQAEARTAIGTLASEEEFGDLLLALVSAGRELGLDAESALRRAARRRIAVIRTSEGLA